MYLYIRIYLFFFAGMFIESTRPEPSPAENAREDSLAIAGIHKSRGSQGLGLAQAIHIHPKKGQ